MKKEKKKLTKLQKVLRVMGILLITLSAIFLIYYFYFLGLRVENKAKGEALILENVDKEDEAEDFLSEYFKNPNVIAYIVVSDSNISYPVMHGGYYLSRDLNGNYLFSGSIFMDDFNNVDFTDDRTVIYGHNMLNGSMFSDLAYIHKDIGNREIVIYTREKIFKYNVFSGLNMRTKDFDNFIGTKGENKGLEFYDYLKTNSTSFKNTSIEEDSKFISLFTCTNSSSYYNRNVIVGILYSEEINHILIKESE